MEVEEFYEEIEAPKFVDFTHPNHFSPDDRFWFCSRVGCDQQHEEEMDSEAIYKNFVLRVMAARSPNVRFRRMSRKPPIESKKCPLSAPPKTSKSRLPRLALVSSTISKKLISEEDGKVKAPPANLKPASAPKARVKYVAAKYMTSPRKNKGSSPNPNAFRSLRNPKKTSVSLPKSKIIAKALVFNSPKKALKKKASLELGTPISKLCEGVKKLQINSQKKGITRKPSKDCTSEKKKLPLDGSKKIMSSSKAKAREADAKFSKNMKSKKAKTNDRKHADAALLEAEKSGDESSDMEIDECDSLGLGPETIKPLADDDRSSKEERTSSSDRPMTAESSGTVSLSTQNSEMISGPDSDDKVSAEENFVPIQAPNADKQSQEKGNTISDDLENQNPGIVSELEENEDKENALHSANIRNLNGDNLSKQHDAPVKPKIKTKQNPKKLDKNSKENCPAETGTQGLKNRKLKPTNPKPFRLRTDERGILKEATQERKINSHENSSTTNENSQGMGNGVPYNGEKGSKKDESRRFKKDQLVSRTPSLSLK